MLRPASLLCLLACLPQDPTKIGFATLAGFDYAEGMTLPTEVTKLDETVVTVSGFMRREMPGGGPVNAFLLINDGCGCEGTPKLNEIVFCTLPAGVTMDVKPGIVTVTGKVFVGEAREEDVVVMLYQLDADMVQ